MGRQEIEQAGRELSDALYAVIKRHREQWRADYGAVDVHAFMVETDAVSRLVVRGVVDSGKAATGCRPPFQALAEILTSQWPQLLLTEAADQYGLATFELEFALDRPPVPMARGEQNV